MPWITPPRQPPNTVFWDIALLFWRMYLRWHLLADDIQYVWLLGTHLSHAYRVIGDFAGECFQFFNTANRRLQNIIGWVDGIIDGDVLWRLIDRLFPPLRNIVNDARGWLETKIRELSFDLYTIIINPWIWIRNQLYEQTPWFWSFINNPGNFILYRLELWYYWIRGFFDNPLNYIINWVREGFYFIRRLELNPSATIVSWVNDWCGWFIDFLNRPEAYIYYWIIRINNDLGAFLTAPYLWLKNRVGHWFAIGPNDWVDIYRRLVEVGMWKIGTSRAIYGARLKNLIVTFILWFM